MQAKQKHPNLRKNHSNVANSFKKTGPAFTYNQLMQHLRKSLSRKNLLKNEADKKLKTIVESEPNNENKKIDFSIFDKNKKSKRKEPRLNHNKYSYKTKKRTGKNKERFLNKKSKPGSFKNKAKLKNSHKEEDGNKFSLKRSFRKQANKKNRSLKTSINKEMKGSVGDLNGSLNDATKSQIEERPPMTQPDLKRVGKKQKVRQPTAYTLFRLLDCVKERDFKNKREKIRAG